MSRMGVGAALVGATITLASQIGCVSPSAAWQEAPEEGSDPQAMVAALESEVAALTAQVAAAQDEAAAARDQAAAAQDQAVAAQDQAAAAQDQAAAARDEAVAARDEAAAAQDQTAAAQTALSQAAAAVVSAQEAAARARAAAARAQEEAAGLLAAAPARGVRVSPGMLDLGSLDLSAAQVAVAGPDSIYVSSIRYGGQPYSALLRYQGGTTATVERIYGSADAVIPATVDLSRTQLSLLAPDTIQISNVDVNGRGYSGQLRHTGGNALEVAGIRQVTLPPRAAQQIARLREQLAAAQAEGARARTAAAAAEADAGAALAELAEASAVLAVMMQDAAGRRIRPALVDFNLLDLDLAKVSAAGPESIYVSGIKYAGGEVAARLRYTGGNRGMVEELFDTAPGGAAELDLSAPAFEVRAPETMVVSNVGIGGAAYSFTLQFERGGEIVITQHSQGHRVRSAAELLRDELLSGPGVTRVVNGVRGGRALPEEGAWITSAAVVSQTDAASSHAKFAFHDVAQPAAPTLYGVTVRAAGDRKVGYGLHVLASGTPLSGNTWNYGRSYLVWATRERDFYDTEATQVQLYESLDGNRLMWLNSRNLLQGLTPGLTLEALYQPEDCAEPLGGAPCYGSITVLVDGAEQFKVAVSAEVARREADAIALRALGGPVEFTDLYVHSRR